MAKPSEKYSSVPDFIRDKFRKYKEQEREMETERERKGREEAPPTSNVSESDRRALDELVDQSASADDQEKYRGKGYRKGGMVKKKMGGMVKKGRSGRGDGCAIRGYTKGRMY